MKVATTDRGAVLGLAGRNHLSPALRDGAPALVPEGENAGRVGWSAYFEAMESAGLAVAWDPEDPGSPAPMPLAQAAALEPHPTLAAGADRARRFWTAFRGGGPAGSAPG
jgi:hypothetical protein